MLVLAVLPIPYEKNNISSDFFIEHGCRRCKAGIKKFEIDDDSNSRTLRSRYQMVPDIDRARSVISSHGNFQADSHSVGEHDNQNMSVPKSNSKLLKNCKNDSRIGYRFSSIELDREWTGTVTEHAKICTGCLLELVEETKRGFELFDIYECSVCKK